MNAKIVEEQRELTVFTSTRWRSCMASGASAALKLGHYMNKKIVPIIEKRSDSFVEPWSPSFLVIFSTGLEK